MTDEPEHDEAPKLARYAFAEPVGPEAFIPRSGDATRNTEILAQAANWYGGRFIGGQSAQGL